MLIFMLGFIIGAALGVLVSVLLKKRGKAPVRRDDYSDFLNY